MYKTKFVAVLESYCVIKYSYLLVPVALGPLRLRQLPPSQKKPSDLKTMLLLLQGHSQEAEDKGDKLHLKL